MLAVLVLTIKLYGIAVLIHCRINLLNLFILGQVLKDHILKCQSKSSIAQLSIFFTALISTPLDLSYKTHFIATHGRMPSKGYLLPHLRYLLVKSAIISGALLTTTFSKIIYNYK